MGHSARQHESYSQLLALLQKARLQALLQNRAHAKQGVNNELQTQRSRIQGSTCDQVVILQQTILLQSLHQLPQLIAVQYASFPGWIA